MTKPRSIFSLPLINPSLQHPRTPKTPDWGGVDNAESRPLDGVTPNERPGFMAPLSVVASPRRARIRMGTVMGLTGSDPLRSRVADMWQDREPHTKVCEAAEDFDAELKRHSVRAGRSLSRLKVDITSQVMDRDFQMSLIEMRTSRFRVQPVRMGPPVSPRFHTVMPLRLESKHAGGPWQHEEPLQEGSEAQKIAKPRRSWKLKDSIWGPRRKWSDSKDFYDRPSALVQAVEADWEAAAKDGSIERAVGASNSNTTSSDDIMARVKAALAAHCEAIYSIFDLYASLGSSADVAHIQFNSYRQLVEDCELIANPKRGNLDGSRWDQLFVAINCTSVDEEEDKYNHKKGLNRQEFLELLVRAANLCFVQPGEISDVPDAISHLITTCILPQMQLRSPMALQNSNDFRLQHCYNEQTDSVLRRHEAALKAIYQAYSSNTQETELLTKRLLDINEWRELLDDLEFIDRQFNEREARMCFVWSRMRVIREGDPKSRKKLLQLSFEDFLEAIVRVATMKALPTDKDIKQAGCHDAGEFYLRMIVECPNRVAPFIESREPSFEMPLQRTHRAVDHLIAIMVRMLTSQSVGAHDLKVSYEQVLKIVKRESSMSWRIYSPEDVPALTVIDDEANEDVAADSMEDAESAGLHAVDAANETQG